MSYILDALRRAESERERGQVPGVHAQPLAAAGPGPRKRGRLWLAAAALSLLLLGGLLARWLATPATAPAPLAVSAPAAVATTPPLPATAPLPELVRLPPPGKPVVVAAAAAPRPAAPVALSALPEALRRQLPPLQTGGAMYSETPANRMLIINGQLHHEGARLAPDLVLEQIRLNGAVLNYRGQRFSIAY